MNDLGTQEYLNQERGQRNSGLSKMGGQLTATSLMMVTGTDTAPAHRLTLSHQDTNLAAGALRLAADDLRAALSANQGWPLVKPDSEDWAIRSRSKLRVCRSFSGTLTDAMSEAADNLLQSATQAQREKRLPDAKNDMVAAISLLRSEQAGEQLAHALRALGELERKLRDTESARTHYEEAVAIFRQHGDALSLAHTVRHLGDVHHDAGRVELAEPCYAEALALYRGHANPPPLDLANAIRSMAVLKEETGEHEQAGRLWSEARELYAAVNVDAGVRESTTRLERLAAS